MRHLNTILVLIVLVFSITACNNQKKSKIMTQKDFPTPPVAAVKADTFTEFGNVRIDNYFWLKDKSNPEVLDYLKAENAYCDTVMKQTKSLQEKLFAEMKGRIKEDDVSVPQIENGYYYYSRTEKDKQYSIYCRKKGNVEAPEEVFFDVNKMAEGLPAYLFAGYEVSDDNKLAVYAFNNTGSFASYTLGIRNLETGMDLPEKIENIQSFSWASDSKTIFYTVGNESLRSYRVFRHEVGSNSKDELIYQEDDELFNLGVGRSKTKDFLFIYSGLSH